METRDKSYCESCSNLFYTDSFIEINYSDSYLLVCDTCSIQLMAEGNQRRTK
jgi:ribosome-binding protein aMBF1 (putative translation factor)